MPLQQYISLCKPLAHQRHSYLSLLGFLVHVVTPNFISACGSVLEGAKRIIPEMFPCSEENAF